MSNYAKDTIDDAIMQHRTQLQSVERIEEFVLRNYCARETDPAARGRKLDPGHEGLIGPTALSSMQSVSISSTRR